MEDQLVQLIFAKPIHLAIQVVELIGNASSFFSKECVDLELTTKRLLKVLRQAAKASSHLYERPTRVIIDDTNTVLEKAHALVVKCGSSYGLLKRVLAIIPASSFRKMSTQLENSVGNLLWLLSVSVPAMVDGDAGLFNIPPIAAERPILYLIWDLSATVYSGSHVDRSIAAEGIVSLAREDDRYCKQIIEEGGVGPLLKLVKDGDPEGQANAAKAIGMLGKDPEDVGHLIHAGVCSAFSDILKQSPTKKVQAMVAWAVSELAGNYPKCQDLFAQHNIIHLLVAHLEFETDEGHTTSTDACKGVEDENDKLPLIKYPLGCHQNLNGTVSSTTAVSTPHHDKNDTIQVVLNDKQNQNSVKQLNNIQDNSQPSLSNEIVKEGKESKDTTTKSINRAMSARALWHRAVNKSSIFRGADHLLNIKRPDQNRLLIESSIGYLEPEPEDTTVDDSMRAMAARALWRLAVDNAAICRCLTESRAMLYFAVLLEKGTKDEQYNSAMALMEITAMVEKDTDIGRSAFKPNSPTHKVVVDQLINIIENGESDLLIPCVRSIGNLARTCRETETKMISPLVRLLDDTREEISKEASIVLSKAVCHENYRCVDNSKVILSAGAAKHLVQLAYFGEIVQFPALILLSYISLHAPDNKELTTVQALTVIEWAERQVMAQNHTLMKLLPEAKRQLELYQ